MSGNNRKVDMKARQVSRKPAAAGGRRKISLPVAYRLVTDGGDHEPIDLEKRNDDIHHVRLVQGRPFAVICPAASIFSHEKLALLDFLQDKSSLLLRGQQVMPHQQVKQVFFVIKKVHNCL